MFSRFAPIAPEEDPGNTLVLQGDSREYAAISQWLATEGRDGFDWSVLPRSSSPEIPPALMPLLSPGCADDRLGVLGFRDRQILHGLLAGACLLRTAGQDPDPENHLTVSTEDYDLVRGLLQSRLVAGADDACDPLAADMVKRANVYMSVKFGGGADASSPFPDSGTGADTSFRPNRELITRREVADLGNVRSRMVRRLVAFLGRQRDGYERFLAMGLMRRPPTRNAWQTMDADDLTGYLRPWSAKQVRTHFEQIRRAGLITAERAHGNGPWRYALPEELNGRHSAFRSLPTAQELVDRAQAG